MNLIFSFYNQGEGNAQSYFTDRYYRRYFIRFAGFFYSHMDGDSFQDLAVYQEQLL